MADFALEEYAKRIEAMKAGQKTSIEDLRKEATQCHTKQNPERLQNKFGN